MRAASLILVMLVIAPIGQSVAEENETSSPLVNEEVMHTYSKAVQIAFERVSDLENYEEEELARAGSWLVVTGVAIEDHYRTAAAPDESDSVRFLKGSYIWTFEDDNYAME